MQILLNVLFDKLYLYLYQIVTKDLKTILKSFKGYK